MIVLSKHRTPLSYYLHGDHRDRPVETDSGDYCYSSITVIIL